MIHDINAAAAAAHITVFFLIKQIIPCNFLSCRMYKNVPCGTAAPLSLNLDEQVLQ